VRDGPDPVATWFGPVPFGQARPERRRISVACHTRARTKSYIKRLWFARPASRGGLLCGRAFVRRPLSRPRYDPAVHPPKSG
jgi:hypothetical protein